MQRFIRSGSVRTFRPWSSTLGLRVRLGLAFAPPLATPAVRQLSASSAQRYQDGQQFYRKLVKDYGADYGDKTINTQFLLDNLRDMQSLRNLKPNDTNSGEYKAALRAIYSNVGETGKLKETMSIKDIEGVLSLENGVTWRLIRELLEFGFSTEIANLGPKERAIVMFNRVHGFGKKKSAGYVEAGARTYEDLLNATDKEFGRKVYDSQKLALTYHSDMEKMMPRAEIEKFQKVIAKALKKADKDCGFEIMGSFRRGEMLSSDMDVVIWHPSYAIRDTEKTKTGIKPDGLMGKVKQALLDAEILDTSKIFSGGEKKILALTQLTPTSIHRQMDIRLCPTQSLPYMLLGNSGDDMLMKIVRNKALNKGWLLNEYGMGERTVIEGSTVPMIKEGTEILVKSEKEIFEKLNLPWLPPTERSYAKYKNKMRDDGGLKGAPDVDFD